MLFFYNSLLYLFKLFSPILFYFSEKGRDWLEGQKFILDALITVEQKYISSKCIWMHCASLGEYEQGKSVLQALKNQYPNHKIILTLFSPSGFKLPATFFYADEVFPLLLDGKNRAKVWIKAIHPEIAIFVKQEFWYHYLKELSLQKIPVFLVSGTISSSLLLNVSIYKNWYLKIGQLFTILFLQSKRDIELASKYGFKNAVLSGNTRVESVLKNKEIQWVNNVLASFTNQSDTIIFGSVWTEDIPYLKHFLEHPLFKNWKIIWAPHDISPKQNKKWTDSFYNIEGLNFFSEVNKSNINSRILILDTMGVLKYAYRYAQLVYVGGGFGKGIHNLLEPIVYQIPVIYGPNHHAFPEATWLIEHGGGFCIHHLEDWKSILEKMHLPAFRINCGMIASSYIAQNMGTIDKILPYLQTVLDKNE
jgi:3-deoxy-D-manno-octulosonic-acid transferase